ncbi:MAG: LPS assembly lipoprotein LptE [Candidatus Acidiferrales bacterium]
MRVSRLTRSACIFLLAAATAVALLASAGCGYHVAGRAAQLPANWKTIAVPQFVNRTSRYRIEQRVTSAVIRELLARTKYRLVQNTDSADAVLRGEITGIETSPVLFDANTGQVTTVLVAVHAKVTLTDRESQASEYSNDNFVFRDEYQISADPASFFEEQDPALERMARDFASKLVAGMLEKF